MRTSLHSQNKPQLSRMVTNEWNKVRCQLQILVWDQKIDQSDKRPAVSLDMYGASCITPERLETELGRSNDSHEKWEMNEWG